MRRVLAIILGVLLITALSVPVFAAEYASQVNVFAAVSQDESCQVTLPQALYCFLISNSFEDCLRTTISIGGDCDTTAAISCAIAEAYYKEIPEDLKQAVRKKLTLEMIEVLDRI